MEIERLSSPYVVEKGEVDGRLVQVTIRAVDGGALGYTELEQATQQILGLFHPELARRSRPSHTVDGDVADRGFGLVRAYDGAAGEALATLEDVYREEHGRVTPRYLAQLAATYEALVPEGRGVSSAIADTLEKPLPTIKGHIMRARREGYLSEAVQGREGGEITDRTRELLEKAGPITSMSIEIGRKTSQPEPSASEAETWRQMAHDLAAEVDRLNDRLEELGEKSPSSRKPASLTINT